MAVSQRKFWVIFASVLATMVVAAIGTYVYRPGGPQYYPGGPDEWVPTPSMRSALEEREGKVLFYGRVIDQDDQPVAGAVAHVSVHSWKDGAQRLEFRADQDGRFTVEAPSADSMSISYLSCDGYSMPPDGSYTEWGFRMGASRTYQPDPQNPVVYRLSKRKEKLQPLVHCGVSRKYYPKGEKIVVDLIGQEVEPVPGDLWFSLDRAPDVSTPRRFSWNLKVGVNEGGIQLADMNKPSWEAPADSYVSSLEWNGTGTDSSSLNKWVFLKLRNGQFYARMNINLNAVGDATSNPTATVSIMGVYGLHGRRWLELEVGPNRNEFWKDARSMEEARRYDPDKPMPFHPSHGPSHSPGGPTP